MKPSSSYSVNLWSILFSCSHRDSTPLLSRPLYSHPTVPVGVVVLWLATIESNGPDPSSSPEVLKSGPRAYRVKSSNSACLRGSGVVRLDIVNGHQMGSLFSTTHGCQQNICYLPWPRVQDVPQPSSSTVAVPGSLCFAYQNQATFRHGHSCRGSRNGGVASRPRVSIRFARARRTTPWFAYSAPRSRLSRFLNFFITIPESS